MREKGLTLPELLISMTILFIVIAATFTIWFSVTRELISQRFDKEMYSDLLSSKNQITDSIIKSIFIYPPNVSVRLTDNFSSFSFNITETVGNNKLLTIIPSERGYYLNVYLTRPRVPTDNVLPNARVLLYYRKLLNWTPQYTIYTISVAQTGTAKTLKIAKINNYPTNITFTQGEGPRVLVDYLTNNGFTINYYVIDLSTLVTDTSTGQSTYTFSPFDSNIPARSINIQNVEVKIRAQRKYQNIVREREINFNSTALLEELPLGY